MADIALPTPYRNPRDAFGNRQAIPGLDVREIQRATPDPAVAAATRARTASIGAAPSIATPPTPAIQPTPAAPQGIAARAGNAVRNTVRSVGATLPLVAGPLAYQAAGQTLGDNTVSTPGVRPTGNSMVDQIPGAGGIAAPPQQAANYFRDTEPGRNINNAINALGGGSAAAANVVRGAGGLVGALRAGSLVQRGANVVRDIGQAVAASNATGATVPSIDFAPSAQAAPVDQGAEADKRALAILQGKEQAAVPSIATPPVVPGAEPDVRAIEERASAINAQSRDIARQLDAFGPGGGGAAGASGLSSAPGGSASAERFNRESLADSQRQMAAGRGIGNMPLRGREAAAFQASASRALTESDQTAAGERIATARNIGELNRASLRDATDRRGQDIGLLTGASAQRNARDIAEMQGKTSRDVATIGADGRIEAAANRVSATKFTPIQLPDEVGADGISTRKMGTALLNNQTGEIVYPTGGQPARPTAPKAGEVKNGYRFKGGDPSKAESWEKVQ